VTGQGTRFKIVGSADIVATPGGFLRSGDAAPGLPVVKVFENAHHRR
jgi:hypothetical protein